MKSVLLTFLVCTLPGFSFANEIILEPGNSVTVNPQDKTTVRCEPGIKKPSGVLCRIMQDMQNKRFIAYAQAEKGIWLIHKYFAYDPASQGSEAQSYADALKQRDTWVADTLCTL